RIWIPSSSSIAVFEAVHRDAVTGTRTPRRAPRHSQRAGPGADTPARFVRCLAARGRRAPSLLLGQANDDSTARGAPGGSSTSPVRGMVFHDARAPIKAEMLDSMITRYMSWR